MTKRRKQHVTQERKLQENLIGTVMRVAAEGAARDPEDYDEEGRREIEAQQEVLSSIAQDAWSGAKQRASGEQSEGRRGKFKVPPEEIEKALHEVRSKRTPTGRGMGCAHRSPRRKAAASRT